MQDTGYLLFSAASSASWRFPDNALVADGSYANIGNTATGSLAVTDIIGLPSWNSGAAIIGVVTIVKIHTDPYPPAEGGAVRLTGLPIDDFSIGSVTSVASSAVEQTVGSSLNLLGQPLRASHISAGAGITLYGWIATNNIFVDVVKTKFYYSNGSVFLI